MQLTELCAHLRLDGGFTEQMEAVAAAYPDTDALLELFDSDGAPGCGEGAFFGIVRTPDYSAFIQRVAKEAQSRGLPVPALYGYVILRLCCRAYDRYAQLGIPEEIYFDTMGDVRYWSGHCLRHEGVWGLAEYDWFTRHPALRLFRLGSLEYEPLVLAADFMGMPRASTVFNVHIPHGAALDEASVTDSFARAAAFFQAEEPVFCCWSWMLDPNLLPLLAENSNIRRFAGRFTLIHTADASPAAEKFLLDGPKADLDQYPQATSLQRKVVDLLRRGGKLGEGCGVYQYKG